MSDTGLKIPELFLIPSIKCTIGRARGNHLVLGDLSVSRFHCVVEKLDHVWTVMDTSANGIYLNSTSIKKHEPVKIKNGDIITLTDKISYCFGFVPGEGYTKPRLVLVQEKDEKITLDDTVINLCETQPQPEASATEATPQESPPVASPLDPMREELTCSICAEIFIKATVLGCMHTFCSYCISTWRKNSNLCPICRAKISREPVTSLVIDNCCKQVCVGLPEDEKKKREEIIQERQQTASSISSKISTQRSGRGRGRGRRQSGRTRQQTGSSRRHNVVEIEISSSDSDDDDDDDLDDLVLLQDALISDFLEYDPGLPGRYYGGYGSCYICHQPGHWANGCPNR